MRLKRFFNNARFIRQHRPLLDWKIARDLLLIKSTQLFDRRFYKRTNPHIRQSDISPILHYYLVGGLDGRDPSPFFNSALYLRNHPKAVARRANPLVDHLRKLKEIRYPQPVLPDVSAVTAQPVVPEPGPVGAQIWAEIAALASHPIISIITPVFNTDPKLLDLCIRSVRAQTYPHWELCLADDGSWRTEVHHVLRRALSEDARIKLVRLPENGGIAKASNAALAHASGEFVGLLDHDDLLEPMALLNIAKGIGEAPDETDLLFTDEDKISVDGHRLDIMLKPGWSFELLRSTMYIGHFTVYRTELVRRVGGFRSEYDFTQDYDLALRASRVVRRAVHVPQVLYHWRATPVSAAADMSNKPGALARQARALADDLMTRGRRGSVCPSFAPGYWHIAYDPPASSLLSIVIPTAGRSRNVHGRAINLIENCIDSLINKKVARSFEIVVVHNGDLGSERERALSARPRVQLVEYYAEEFNLSDKLNLGVRAAHGDFVLLLNDDTEVITPHFGDLMMGIALDPSIGAVGAKLLFEDETLQHNGVIWSTRGPTHAMYGHSRHTPGPLNMLQQRRDVLGVTGACLMCRRDTFWAVGGFDLEFPLNYNDVDFCLKLRTLGLRIVIDPNIELFHYESASKAGVWPSELERLIVRHGMLDDPYFNKHFDRSDRFYEITSRRPKEIYLAWLLARIAQRQANLQMEEARAIRFSILVSVYDQTPDLLEALFISIFAQTHSNFELIVVDNGSSRTECLDYLQRLARKPNTRLIREPHNLGIIRANRIAFDAASGDYVIPVDADDILTVDALAVLAHEITRAGRPAVLYTDEDKLLPTLQRVHPFIKPGWDPILFTNCCYVAHLTALRRDVAEAVGVYSDTAADFCHDWDSFWRMVRAGHAPTHVPEVTYSWRIHPGSTSSVQTDAKPDANRSQRHVLTQQLHLTGRDTHFEIVTNELFDHDKMWRIRPRIEAMRPVTVVAFANQDTQDTEVTCRALEVLAKQTHPDFSIILVDQENAGPMEMRKPVSRSSGLRGISRYQEKSLGAALMEIAASMGSGHLLAVLGKGAIPATTDWLTEGAGLIDFMDDIDVVGGPICDQSDVVLFGAGYFGLDSAVGSDWQNAPLSHCGYTGFNFCQRSVDIVSPAHFVVRTDTLLAQASGVSPITPSDLMLTLAIHAGVEDRRVVYTPFMRAGTMRLDLAVPVPEPATSIPPSRYYSPAAKTSAAQAWEPDETDYSERAELQRRPPAPARSTATQFFYRETRPGSQSDRGPAPQPFPHVVAPFEGGQRAGDARGTALEQVILPR